MRDKRKKLIGVVTSDKMDKTVVVSITTLKRHPMYGKAIRHTTKFKAHDAENTCTLGDRVEIIESKPISRDKRWVVTSILERAK